MMIAGARTTHPTTRDATMIAPIAALKSVASATKKTIRATRKARYPIRFAKPFHFAIWLRRRRTGSSADDGGSSRCAIQ
jgi:hypothetical protein